MTNDSVRFIQISDTHLFSDVTTDLLGVKTEESLAAVLQCIKDEKNNFDFIIHTGDLSQDQSEHSYKRIADLLSQFNVPVYWIAGNHDDYALMLQLFPYAQIKNNKQIILDHWQLILLNSQQVGQVHGFLNAKELNFMHQCLTEYPKLHAMILMHHQPINIGSQWLDNLGVLNHEEFWEVARKFPQIKYVCFGHIHQEFSVKQYNIECFSAPSTCIQFKRNQDEFGLEALSPGYRWIELFKEGYCQTKIIRAEKYIPHFDPHAKRY